MRIEVEVDESGLESDEWIAVYKRGLSQIVKERALYLRKLVDLIGIDEILKLEEELKNG